MHYEGPTSETEPIAPVYAEVPSVSNTLASARHSSTLPQGLNYSSLDDNSVAQKMFHTNRNGRVGRAERQLP
jgi:hypothetical protein